MEESLCGVCNHKVPMYHAQIGRIEKDGSLTSYHLSCEVPASKIKPCVDCGHHKLVCSECKEMD